MLEKRRIAQTTPRRVDVSASRRGLGWPARCSASARLCKTLGVLLPAVLLALPVQAQQQPRLSKHDLPKIYREARFQRMLGQIYGEHGLRVTPFSATALPSPHADSLLAWLAPFYPDYVPYVPPPKPVRVERWKLIQRNEWITYARQFDAVKWAYLGNNYFTAVDTTFTQEVRARMQARFGAPTKTLAELDFSRNLRMDEYIQFEYWFILNDSIPMIVMDVNGPFDRGVVVACDHRYREALLDLRQSFLTPMMEEGRLAPYVDYYFYYRRRRWYRTGFDGQHFFTDPIGQPNLARGRPQLRSEGG